MPSPRPMDQPTTDPSALREAVRARYAAAATAVTQPNPVRADDALAVLEADGCCGAPSGDTSCCGTVDKSIVTRDLYRVDEVAELPSAAVLASLGCGNPTALAELKSGEVVLDLGSGGGIDVLLSARRVGASGFAYGLDMTDEMLLLAELNAREAGVSNVRFLKGEIERIPLPDSSVDVVISNCVINLSADKSQVLREAFRVLKPSGRFAVSDVVVQGDLPTEIRASLEQWVGCIAGAIEERTYRRLLTEAGFVDVSVEVTRIYDAHEAGAAQGQVEGFAAVEATGGRLVSAFVRSIRPDAPVSEGASSVPMAATPDRAASASQPSDGRGVLEDELHELATQEDRLVDAIAGGLIEREAAQRKSARIKSRRLAIHDGIERLGTEKEARQRALQYVLMARTEGIGTLVLGMPVEDKRKFFRAAFKTITLDGLGRGRWRKRSVKGYELSEALNTFILKHASA